jgi:DNA-binding LytR/AlgR family response regulator
LSLKALLVDDEYPSRNELRFRLERYPEIEVVGEAANAREALQLCSAMDYDVVFLDIQMPGMDGVELAQALRVGGKNPKVVFVTAYEEYAVNAFKVRATDYLLKPFDDARLDDTVQRLLEGRNGREARPEGKKPQPPLAWVPTEVNGTTVPVPVEDIVYIYSEKDYVFVRTFADKLITRFTLQELTERLSPRLFFRCHRSYLVNVRQVKEIIPYINGAYLLRMKDKQHSEVAVSRGRVRHLKELFALQ